MGFIYSFALHSCIENLTCVSLWYLVTLDLPLGSSVQVRLDLDFFVTAVASVNSPKSEFTGAIVVMMQDKEQFS